ncbi:MAG: GlcG/HbpS family heme-binding protein [Lactobacillaceae bacterium]|nr:heme-binding protein [Bombilactobacillus mellis]
MNEEQVSKIIKDIINNDKTINLFDLHKMEKVIDAAISRANELNVGVTIAIMKSDQVLQMSYHMPNANLVSCTLAPKKAWSALAMKEPTKDISKDIQPGGSLYQMETMLNGKLASFAGGIPLEINGEIVGAIGVSGGLVEEDQSICEAAVSEFLKESK